MDHDFKNCLMCGLYVAVLCLLRISERRILNNLIGQRDVKHGFLLYHDQKGLMCY